MNKIQKILNFAMRMEKDAGDFYEYYMDKVKSESTKALFKELVDVEKKHYSILKEKYDELGLQDPPLTISWVVDNSFAAKDPHILADNSDMVGDAANEISDLTVIRMAYLIESDFAVFYRKAADSLEEGEAKKLLNTLADWENQHRDMFHKRYQELLDKYWEGVSGIIFED